ncbi:unnamed protein product [Allacma fusca]|uniref:Uncharacterized protein n=1 Tax=Allacma fusca TaxID=39272 RepID=A0A8J2PPN9_9HEXA|nr:unnamed protein product [Allacma fusca]
MVKYTLKPTGNLLQRNSLAYYRRNQGYQLLLPLHSGHGTDNFSTHVCLVGHDNTRKAIRLKALTGFRQHRRGCRYCQNVNGVQYNIGLVCVREALLLLCE